MKTEIFDVCDLVMTIIDKNFIKDSYTVIPLHHDVSMMNTNSEKYGSWYRLGQQEYS